MARRIKSSASDRQKIPFLGDFRAVHGCCTQALVEELVEALVEELVEALVEERPFRAVLKQ
jgi:hypothetical protein